MLRISWTFNRRLPVSLRAALLCTLVGLTEPNRAEPNLTGKKERKKIESLSLLSCVHLLFV